MGTDNKDICSAKAPSQRCGHNGQIPPESKFPQASDKWPEEAQKRNFDREYDRPYQSLINEEKLEAIHNLVQKIGCYYDGERIQNHRLFHIERI